MEWIRAEELEHGTVVEVPVSPVEALRSRPGSVMLRIAEDGAQAAVQTLRPYLAQLVEFKGDPEVLPILQRRLSTAMATMENEELFMLAHIAIAIVQGRESDANEEA